MFLTTNSPSAQMTAVVEGLGLAVLSHRWASEHPTLVRLLPAEDVRVLGLWLVSHLDLRHSARIRVVAEYIRAAVERDAQLFLSGR